MSMIGNCECCGKEGEIFQIANGNFVCYECESEYLDNQTEDIENENHTKPN